METQMNWSPPSKPAELAESRLIAAILEGHFCVNDTLPGERDLAAQLGVTRPTLREALQRLARDGWVEIRHGKPTRVRDYWQEGNLGVLAAIAQYPQHAPPNFVLNLLNVRCLLAPAYSRQAVERAPQDIAALIQGHTNLPDTPEAYATADWELHHRLTIASGNPIFTLILNGFRDLYPIMAQIYFSNPAARAHSQAYYAALLDAVQRGDPDAAEKVTRRVMRESVDLWRAARRE